MVLLVAILNVSCTATKDLSTSVKANNPPTEFIKFADVTAATGINPGGRCAAWGDLNNDGWTDLIADGRIYRNEEGKKFVDVTTKTTAEYRGPCLIADFNGDGINDIYFSDNGGALFLGKGGFTFTRGKAALNPRPAFGLAAADFDNDGWIDIYIANYENWEKQLDYPDVILRNNHGELIEQWVAPDEKLMRGRGATCCDFNNDQLIDIYVSNYRLMPNFLWVNHGGWNLVDEARAFGCAGSERKDVVFQNGKGLSYGSSGHTIGSVWADFDNDTYFDLFVGNFSHPPTYQDRPKFLKNGGPANNYYFIDKSAVANIPWQESYGSPAAGDVDNDGLVDLAYTTCYKGDTSRLFRNLGNWRFQDITPVADIRCNLGTQCAFADFDNDGRLDLFINGRLLRNISTTSGKWLNIVLVGKAPNTSVPGAKVIACCDGRKYIRQVETGTGSGNQNDLRLHFGLGEIQGPVKLEVIWPDGIKSQIEAAPNQIITIRRPQI